MADLGTHPLARFAAPMDTGNGNNRLAKDFGRSLRILDHIVDPREHKFGGSFRSYLPIFVIVHAMWGGGGPALFPSLSKVASIIP